MQGSSVGGIPGVVLAVTLTFIGVVVALSCTWMTSKKRRVANNALQRGDGLMLHVAGKSASPRIKPPSKRYSTPTPVVILPINSIAHTLVTPTIIITPPSPLAILADSTSIRSDSSIGSAGDLLFEDDGANDSDEGEKDDSKVDFCGDSLNEEKVKREKKKYIVVQNKQHIVEPVLYRVHECDTGTTDAPTIHQVKTVAAGGTSNPSRSHIVDTDLPHTKQNSQNRSHIVSVNVMTTGQSSDLTNDLAENQGHHRVAELTHCNEITDGELEPVLVATRPRLKSMEPGTKRSDFHFQGAKHISQVQVGKS